MTLRNYNKVTICEQDFVFCFTGTAVVEKMVTFVFTILKPSTSTSSWIFDLS